MWVKHSLLLLFTCGFKWTQSYCAGLGANPGFSAAPEVSQVTLTSILVSWQGLGTRLDCADQFIVKSWRERYPNDYAMSDLLPLTQFSYVVTGIVPNQDYVIQVVAREDKGLLGKDWNKSPKAYFRTTRNTPTVPPETWIDGVDASNNPSRWNIDIDQSIRYPSLFMLVGIILGGLLLLLVVIGGLWNMIKSRRKNQGTGEYETESESDNDSLDLYLENTDMASRVGGSRPASRARSRRSSSQVTERARRGSPMSEILRRNSMMSDRVRRSSPISERAERCGTISDEYRTVREKVNIPLGDRKLDRRKDNGSPIIVQYSKPYKELEVNTYRQPPKVDQYPSLNSDGTEVSYISQSTAPPYESCMVKPRFVDIPNYGAQTSFHTGGINPSHGLSEPVPPIFSGGNESSNYSDGTFNESD